MSDARSLEKEDWIAQGKMAVVYLAPVILIYISPILAELQKAGHVISPEDFALTPARITAISVWVLSQLEGLLIRWAAGK